MELLIIVKSKKYYVTIGMTETIATLIEKIENQEGLKINKLFLSQDEDVAHLE